MFSFAHRSESARSPILKHVEEIFIPEAAKQIGAAQNVVLLLGSIISVPAGAPSVTTIIEGFKNAAGTCKNAVCGPDLGDRVNCLFRRFLSDYKDTIPFEEIVRHIRIIWPDIEERIEETYSPLETPCFNHRAIAHIVNHLLHKKKNVTILTTNWECLLENALQWNPDWKEEKDESPLWATECHLGGSLTYAKLHGSVGHGIATVFDKIARGFLKKTHARLLQTLQESDAVLVAGYGANDVDIRPLLHEWTPKQPLIWFDQHDPRTGLNSEMACRARRMFFDKKGELWRLLKGNLLDSSTSPLVKIAEIFGFAVEDTATEPKQAILALPQPRDCIQILTFIGNACHWVQDGEIFATARLLWMRHGRKDNDIPVAQRIEGLCYSNLYGEALGLTMRDAGNNRDRLICRAWRPFMGQLLVKSDDPSQREISTRTLSALIVGLLSLVRSSPRVRVPFPSPVWTATPPIPSDEGRWLSKNALKSRRQECQRAKYIRLVFRVNVAEGVLQRLPWLPMGRLLRRWEEQLKMLESRAGKVGDFVQSLVCRKELIRLRRMMKSISDDQAEADFESILHLFLMTSNRNTAIEVYRQLSKVLEKGKLKEAIAKLEDALTLTHDVHGYGDTRTRIAIERDLGRLRRELIKIEGDISCSEP